MSHSPRSRRADRRRLGPHRLGRRRRRDRRRPGARVARAVRRRAARPRPCPPTPRPSADQWRQVLAKPADARNRVLVALERNRVVGFALTSPASDPDCDPVADGELAEVTLDPAERGKGHGSRLLQAAVDTLAADRFTRAVTWVNAGDDALRTFLTDAGLGARHGPPRARPRRHRARPRSSRSGSTPRSADDRRSSSTARIHPGLLVFPVAGVTMEVRPLRRSSTGVPHARSASHTPQVRPRPRRARRLHRARPLARRHAGGPAQPPVGLLAGAAAGVAAAFVLVHDFHQRQPARRARDADCPSGRRRPSLGA